MMANARSRNSINVSVEAKKWSNNTLFKNHVYIK